MEDEVEGRDYGKRVETAKVMRWVSICDHFVLLWRGVNGHFVLFPRYQYQRDKDEVTDSSSQ